MAKRIVWREAVALAGLGAMALGAIYLAGRPRPSFSSSRAVVTEHTAPAWRLHDLDGKLFDSAQLRGHVVLLDFWATWCGPCRAQIPHLIALQRAYGDQGFTVVGVALDRNGPEAVRRFVRQVGINYPILLATPPMLAAFGGVAAIPTAVLIDRHNRIVMQHVGYADKALLEQRVRPLLKP